MLDAGVLLEAAQRLVPRRQLEPDQRDERNQEGKTEARKQDAMQQRRRQAPQIEQREDQKDGGHHERPQQRFPDALGDQREPAQAHAPLEAPRKLFIFGGRCQAPS